MANQVLVEIARRSEPSVPERSYYGMSQINWTTEINVELSTRCPVVSSILETLLQTDYYPEKKFPALCLIYGIIMLLRCHELSRTIDINITCASQYKALSYTITGGAACHGKVKPKTWRIFTFADDNWCHHHGYWYHQLPLTRLISEPATIFTPPWFFQNNFRCFFVFLPVCQ